MADNTYPNIRDLGLIGDRCTAAVVTTDGSIVWYCPQRFDRPSLLAALLDPERGGAWRVRSPNLTFTHRRYLEDSGVLKTTFSTSQGQLHVTDWMPWGDHLPRGICRHFSPAPQRLDIVLQAAPDYARRPPKLQALAHPNGVQIDTSQHLYASHPLEIDGECLRFSIPPGESGWAALLDCPVLETPTQEKLTTWLATTLASWRQVASHITYRGIYEQNARVRPKPTV